MNCSRSLKFFANSWPSVSNFKRIKAELLQEGILFGTQFPSLVIFISKKVEFHKTKTSLYTTFKTDLIKVVIVFSEFQLFY